jgi:hypothetical protein
MKAVIHYKGTPLSKQNGHRVSFKNISEHMRLKDMGIKKTGKKFFYSTGDYATFKEELGWEAAAQLRRQGWIFVDEEPIWISILFKANRNLGDISNLIGGIEDALNGLVWKDDCQALLKTCYGVIRPDIQTTEITIVVENYEGSDPCADKIRAWVLDGLKRRRRKNAG